MSLTSPTKWLVMLGGLMSLGLGSKIISHITSPIKQLDRIMGLLNLSKSQVTSLTKQLNRVASPLDSSKA